jgi:hypothetical protein
MDVWVSTSNPGKQLALAAGCTATGLALAIGFREFDGFGTNAFAGFGLGILLLVIGIAGLLVNGRQTVVIDPSSRHIIIEDSNRLRSKKRKIRFNEIVDISIGYLGKRSNFVTWYYLVLKLRTGEEYPLFSPGRFYEGGADRNIVASWKQRLEEYLAQ